MNADTLLNILPLSRNVSTAMRTIFTSSGFFRVMWVVEFEDFTVQHVRTDSVSKHVKLSGRLSTVLQCLAIIQMFSFQYF